MSASQTSSAASSEQPSANTESRRKSSRSSSESRSYDHSIVARSVCWRGSASRPPLRRSRRCPSRSRICPGASAFARAAASSTASGRLSSRPHSSAISSVGSSEARAQKSATASAPASGGTGYSTSPCTRRSSRDVTSSERFGQAASSAATSGDASITCSKLSTRRSSSRSPMCSASPFRAPSVAGDRVGDERVVAERRQVDPEDAGGERRDERRGRLDRDPRLARAAGAGERDQPRAVLDPRRELGQLPLAADERARRPREVRVRDRLERRKALVAELEDRNRVGQVLEPVLAEVGERPLDERCGRAREDRLAAVRRGRDAGGRVHVLAHVALGRHERMARVEAGAHADRPVRERLGQRLGRRDGAGRGREHDEEPVALRVHLDPAVRGAGRADQAPVFRERLGVALGAEFVQQPRRSLHVREEERDRAGRKFAAHGGIMTASGVCSVSHEDVSVVRRRRARGIPVLPFLRDGAGRGRGAGRDAEARDRALRGRRRLDRARGGPPP